MNTYAVLKKQVFSNGKFTLVPIRYEDRFDIMKWRNEQIYHLRQNKPLTKKDQENYFKNIITPQFIEEYPKQILFSFLEEGKFIGYGGLVHINWVDKNAEISFVMNTEFENDYFDYYWKEYLIILEEVAFKDLRLHKIFTYAFDLRPLLYKALESSGYNKEAILKEHCNFNDVFLDVILHSKINFNEEIISKRS